MNWCTWIPRCGRKLSSIFYPMPLNIPSKAELPSPCVNTKRRLKFQSRIQEWASLLRNCRICLNASIASREPQGEQLKEPVLDFPLYKNWLGCMEEPSASQVSLAEEVRLRSHFLWELLIFHLNALPSSKHQLCPQ